LGGGSVNKPNWDEYFIGMLSSIAARASCDRGRSAAILVKNNRILSTGYVGAPAGLPECDDIGHELALISISRESQIDKGKMMVTSQHCLRTNHAELNVIANAARDGHITNEATLYCSMVPCETCAKLIIQSGIVRVVAKNAYHRSEITKKLFLLTHITLKVIDENTTY
jgi:dCMP deaminase